MVNSVDDTRGQCGDNGVKFLLSEIGHDQRGFEELARLHAQTKDSFLEDIEIDMHAAKWFAADMCAAFGAILYHLGSNLNAVDLVNIDSKVEEILSKNGFLSHYGREKIPDSWGTTVSYQRFDVEDDHYFSGYIESEFVVRPEMPEISPGLAKKFHESIFEIFSNAVLHSRTKLGIFSCGQFFPHQDRLYFTVADLGIGMRQNIKECNGLALSSEEAIVWATEAHNTTKRASVPGGLGLKLLGEFIELNGGCIRIVSDDGYWEKKKNDILTARLSHPFPGTVVSLEINTADTSSYSLASEMEVDDIF